MHAIVSRIVFSIALSGLASLAGGAAPASGRSIAPAAAAAQSSVLRFEPPTLDLGEMIAGQPKTASLTVTNTGTAAVTVRSMKGGCGCTRLTEPPKDAISPGASFSVEVTVDPGMRTGIELRKPVHVVLADGSTQTMYVVGRVKTVILVDPEAIDVAAAIEAGVSSLAKAVEGSAQAAQVSIESVDRAPFRVTGSNPAGILTVLAGETPSTGFELVFDHEAWRKAGRPASVSLSTDRADAREIAIPIKASDAVAMFRLPRSEGGRAAAKSADAVQDTLIRAIDAGLAQDALSTQFRMRFHRESGMLFVHGTASDLDAVRAAVRALPASSDVRESQPLPRG